MKLYQSPLSTNCRKVFAVLRHLDLACEMEDVDLKNGAHREPAFLKLNPNAKVPVLQDGETVLWESNAIMMYIASKKDTSLWPKSNQRYDITRWMCWELAHFGPAIGTIVFENMLKPAFGLGKPDAAAVADASEKVARFAKVLDGHLAEHGYLSGGALTLADFAVASHLTYRGPARLPLDDYTHILAWARALDEVPAWRDSAPKLG